jgi:hypothetical protein
LAGGIALVLGLCSGSNAAVVIPIEGPAKALFSSKEPTMTMLFEAEKPAKATILFLPGGDGVVPLKEGMTESKNPFFLGIFGPLIKGGYNVVTVGTPYPIDHGRSATVSDDRLDRIESGLRLRYGCLDIVRGLGKLLRSSIAQLRTGSCFMAQS